MEYPTGSGQYLNLQQVAEALAGRLCNLFLPNANGERAIYHGSTRLQHNPHFRDYLLFYEYFHGENGRGMGAPHQTGWTGLIALLLAPGYLP